MEMWKDAKFGDILSKNSFEEPPFDLACNSGSIYLPLVESTKESSTQFIVLGWELDETFHME